MLYHGFELYQRSLRAWNPFFDISRDMLAQSVGYYTDELTGKTLKAMLEAGTDFTKNYGKPEFGISKVEADQGKFHVKQTTVLQEPFCNLLHFKHKDFVKRPRVLLVAPLSGHHATLCKSTVETLIPDHDLYVTDWLDAKHVALSKGKFSFDDYASYLIYFLEHLGGGSHIIAICQPAVQTLIATALLSAKNSPAIPASMTLMAGPVDTRINSNKVNDFADKYPREWYKNSLIQTVPYGYAGAGRRVYPGFLQLGSFMTMNISAHMEKFQSYFQHLIGGDMESVDRHREFYDEYLSVLDLTEEFYMETLDRVFREHHLARGEMIWNDERVDLGAITKTALFTVEGENDDICAVGQTEAAHLLCKNLPADKRKHHVQPEVGHFGVFSGSKFRDNIAPQIVEFIKSFDR